MDSTENIEAQKRITDLANRIVGGEIDVASGVWALYPHICTLRLESNRDYVIFDAFRSATDHLPLPSHKANWERRAYSEMANELKRIEDEYRDRVVSACSTLNQFLKRQQY
jgi:hypothetical protein